MEKLRICLWIFACTLWFFARTNGQCTLSIVYPLEGDARTITLSKATTSVTVQVRITCTDVTDLPTGETNTDVIVATPHNVVTADTLSVVIFSGTTSSDFELMVESMNEMDDETFTVMLPSTNSIDLDPMKDTLTFTLRAISEVSFADPRAYQGELGDIIEVKVVRTNPLTEVGTLSVVEVSTNYLSLSPATLMFAATEATATVTAMITDHDPSFPDATLGIGTFSSSLILSRVTDEVRAVITILSPPTLSVPSNRVTVTLVATGTEAVFVIMASRTVSADVTITLVYEPVGEPIYLNPQSTVVLTAGTTQVSVPLTIDPPNDEMEHSFTVRIASATGSTNIDQNNDQTTFILPVADVLVSIPLRFGYTANEGDTIQVTLLADKPAPSEIEIDLISTDSAQFQPLPNAVISMGQTRGTVGINVLEDGIPEGDTTVTITFRSETSGTLVVPGEDYIQVVIQGIDVTIGGDNDPVIDTPAGPAAGQGEDDSESGADDSSSSGEGLSGGAIAGIVIGAVGGVFFILMIAIVCGMVAMSGRGGFGGYGGRYGASHPYPRPHPRPYHPYGPRYPPPPVIYEVEY